MPGVGTEEQGPGDTPPDKPSIRMDAPGPRNAQEFSPAKDAVGGDLPDDGCGPLMDTAPNRRSGVIETSKPPADGGQRYSLPISRWPPGIGEPAMPVVFPPNQISRNRGELLWRRDGQRDGLKDCGVRRGERRNGHIQAAPRRLDAPDQGLMIGARRRPRGFRRAQPPPRPEDQRLQAAHKAGPCRARNYNNLN
jgi:hypothetical protein